MHFYYAETCKLKAIGEFTLQQPGIPVKSPFCSTGSWRVGSTGIVFKLSGIHLQRSNGIFNECAADKQLPGSLSLTSEVTIDLEE
jgi:hypothetical protein